MAGILLAKLGVASRIIERDITLSPLSKAIGIHARTLELFKLTDKDLFKRFEDESWENLSMRFYFGGNLTADVSPIPSKDSEFTVPWMLMQSRTVEILTEEYEKTGMGRVDRGWELYDTKVVEQEKAVENREDGSVKATTTTTTTSWVETTIRRAIEGTNERKGERDALGVVDMAAEDEDKQYVTKVVRSEYLIGADGGRSTVRHRLNIPFPGRTRDYNLILFDGCVETELSTSSIA